MDLIAKNKSRINGFREYQLSSMLLITWNNDSHGPDSRLDLLPSAASSRDPAIPLAAEMQRASYLDGLILLAAEMQRSRNNQEPIDSATWTDGRRRGTTKTQLAAALTQRSHADGRRRRY